GPDPDASRRGLPRRNRNADHPDRHPGRGRNVLGGRTRRRRPDPLRRGGFGREPGGGVGRGAGGGRAARAAGRRRHRRPARRPGNGLRSQHRRQRRLRLPGSGPQRRHSAGPRFRGRSGLHRRHRHQRPDGGRRRGDPLLPADRPGGPTERRRPGIARGAGRFRRHGDGRRGGRCQLRRPQRRRHLGGRQRGPGRRRPDHRPQRPRRNPRRHGPPPRRGRNPRRRRGRRGGRRRGRRCQRGDRGAGRVVDIRRGRRGAGDRRRM
ncbi:MAG: hypothetical protein AVDCRST_MAG73-4058, partial [uncultured Thermomicrobiales bacterium]